MKNKLLTQFLLAIVLGIAAFAALSGCGGSTGSVGSNGQGTLTVHMSDGGGDGVTAMNITITRIEANINGQWQTISTSTQSLNLMDLVQQDVVLATSPVPAGTYSQIRLFVSSATVTDATGTHDVIIPSVLHTGIKINLNFDVPANQLVGVLLDFNVGQSLVREGNGTYRLKPVIPAVVQILSGTVTGTVSDSIGVVGGASVTATYESGPNYTPGTIVNTTTTMADGTFKVWALLPGTYTFTISKTLPDNTVETATVTGVVVTANQNVDIGAVTLTTAP